MHRSHALVVATALVAALAGCSQADDPAGPRVDPSPADEAQALTVPATASDLAAAGLLPDAVLDESRSAEHGVVPGTETAVDRYGEYTRVTLAPDAPVLTFDPAGPWAEVTQWLDPTYVQQALGDGASFFVEEWVDAPTRWDDSAQAWADLNTETGELMQAVGQDVRGWVAGGDGADRLFDLGDWREDLGIRPVGYAPGAPRFQVADLAVTDMAVYAPLAESGDMETIGLLVTFEITTDELVVTSDGGIAHLHHWQSLTLKSLQATGAVERLEWNASYQLGRELEGGMAALPVLATPAAVPAGWEAVTVEGLTLAVPDGAAAQSDDDPDSGWTGYPLGTTSADGESVLWVRGPREVSEGTDSGQWFALEGFLNYGLVIPGADVAAAEVGHDVWGQFRARVFVQATRDGAPVSYRVEWDTTPERAEAELIQIAGTMSVSAS